MRSELVEDFLVDLRVFLTFISTIDLIVPSIVILLTPAINWTPPSGFDASLANRLTALVFDASQSSFDGFSTPITILVS